MSSLFAQTALVDLQGDLYRNIVSLRISQDLYDDLSDDPREWELAQQVEHAVRPPLYRSHTPIIDRPFEDAAWFTAIGWPFTHWQVSRFSDGTFGVWYGAKSIETTVYESAYHWYRGLLSDAGFEHEEVTVERRVYRVACQAALVDLRPAIASHPELIHKTDYTFTHTVGARLHREGHPGLITQSVRHPSGVTVAVFNRVVLSDPRHDCYLTYQLREGTLHVIESGATPRFSFDPTML